MKKVLIGFIEDLTHSGIDKYLLGVIDAAKSVGCRPDFMTSRFSEDTEKYLAERGCRLISVPSLKNPAGQYRTVKKLVAENGYDAVYLNISEPLNCVSAFAAKKTGAKQVMIHAHSSYSDRTNPLVRSFRVFLSFLCRGALSRAGTDFFACSDKAAKWMFSGKALEKTEIIYNSTDLEKFAFDAGKREKTRELLCLKDEFTLIFVGNFCYQKNVFFTLSVFSELLKIKPSSVLLMAGTGQDLGKAKKKAEELGIFDKIKFLGVRSDIPELLAASDAFLLPSRFEGLGIVYIEAQASGLYTFASERVPETAKISDRLEFIPLSAGAMTWAEKIAAKDGVPRTPGDIYPAPKENYSAENGKKVIAEKIFG